MAFEPETVWEFTMADSVTFGTGAVSELPHAVSDLGAGTVLVVTDPGVRDAGIVDTVTTHLDGAVDYDVFDGVEPDPAMPVYDAALEAAADTDPDVIVGLGGGSSMDVAKVISAVHAHGGDILDYVAEPTGAGEPIPGEGVPTVCVPTTAGTGSETSPVAVVSLPEQNLKVGISSQYILPNVALVDPLLQATLPAGPTASSGMDALCHAIEAYTTRRYDAKARAETPADRPDYNGRNPLTDALARTAIELVGDNIRQAVDNGEDIEARRGMALGSHLAAAAFTNAGLGATHAIAMSTGAHLHTPHGVTIAKVFPEVMRFNAPSAFDRYADVADILGMETAGLSDSEAADAAATAVERIREDVGLGGGLSDLDVTAEDVPVLTDKTMKMERLLVGNPRRVEREDIESILRASL
ncbi:MAG: hydroxyacid-oxoacid transhydrogenase [Halobacteriaceae archaeon]